MGKREINKLSKLMTKRKCQECKDYREEKKLTYSGNICVACEASDIHKNKMLLELFLRG